MNNEPVAWMPIQSRHTRIQETKPEDEQNWVPLYLHPAKTLTDGEILNALQEAIECAESDSNGGGVDWYAYAEQWKTILRKAQEK